MSQALAQGLLGVFSVVFNILTLFILGSVICSWVNADPRNVIVRVINAVCEPMYNLVRPLTNKIPIPLDLAPMIIILLLIFLEGFVGSFLRQAATGM